jgi:1-acyl-sn-glycerol-3-phosphate acyltransferase
MHGVESGERESNVPSGPRGSGASSGSSARNAASTPDAPSAPGAPSEAGERSAPARASQPILTHKTFVYHFCSAATLLFCKTYFRLRVEGLENIPKSGGAVLASNHQSFVDILILGGCMPRHIAFVARDTLAEWRWLAYTMRQCGAVLVRRGTSDRRALRAMAEHLEQDDIVVIYPEGTRTRDGSLQEFKGGALLAARMAGVPIIPCGVRGAFEAWPRGRTIPRPKKIGVRFGPPIDSALPDAQERMIAAIQSLIGDGRYASLPPIR